MAFYILKCPKSMIEYRVYRIPENPEEGSKKAVNYSGISKHANAFQIIWRKSNI